MIGMDGLAKVVRAGAAAALLTACGGEPLDPGTGVEAVVRRGPINPVEMPGVENTAPVAGAEVVLRRDGDVVARAPTDAEGRVTLLATPGRYSVRVTECPGALGLPEPQPVTVLADRIESVRLECDTGIR